MGYDDVGADKELDHGIVDLAACSSERKLGRAHPRVQRLVPCLVHKLIQVVAERDHFAIVGAKQRVAHIDEVGKQFLEP